MGRRSICWDICVVLFLVAFSRVSTGEEKDTDEKDKVQFLCHTCNSGDPKEPNVNCLGNTTVNFPTTWKANCTEKCFIRTNILYPGTTYRGCTDLFPQLPKPLAEDGCYHYYLDTWCLCSKNLCNGDPMGEPMEKELDEHLWDSTGETPGDGEGSAGPCRPSSLLIVLTILIVGLQR